MAFVLVSCNPKNKEATTEHYDMMNNESIMLDNSSSNKMMTEEMCACPMHPEVQGKLNDKCSKCGMKLTEAVAEKTEESK